MSEIKVVYPPNAERENELMRQRRAFYNEALDWAAGFVIDSVDDNDDEKVKEFACHIFRSLKANKIDL